MARRGDPACLMQQKPAKLPAIIGECKREFFMQRSSGILLHPTSLPGSHGVGDIAAGYRFADWLAEHKQSAWQILPLNPPGAGISPYSCQSSHAGNPALISLAMLADQTGLLKSTELEPLDATASIEEASDEKYRLLSLAAERFQRLAEPAQEPYRQWCIQNQWWLASDALFHAISQQQRTTDWTSWPSAVVKRDPDVLARLCRQLDTLIQRWSFIQWVFDQQWLALKAHVNAKGIEIIGDLPIYCAHHSVDVWANQTLFELSADGHGTVVAGVPPDYFSATGQRWGSPLYRWDQHQRSKFIWWRDRMASALKWCDRLRIDHFRAFASYWAIPGEAPDAISGKWIKGPGKPFFDAMNQSFDPLPIIVEDLGHLTDDVIELRDQLGLPGMSILQFAFGAGPHNVYLPHRLERNTVVYTGTHDNDTCLGWWASASAEQKAHFSQYFGTRSKMIHRTMIRAALASVADLAIIPMQDVLAAGSEARMNTPGEASDQWTWRFDWSQLTKSESTSLVSMTVLYGRAPQPENAKNCLNNLEG